MAEGASQGPNLQAPRPRSRGVFSSPSPDPAVFRHIPARESMPLAPRPSPPSPVNGLVAPKNVLKTGSFDRHELEEIESDMGKKTRLWRGIRVFEENMQAWEGTPFNHLDTRAMEAEILRCDRATPAGRAASDRLLSAALRPRPPSRSRLPPACTRRSWRVVQLSEKQLPTNPAVGRLKHAVAEAKRTVPVLSDLRNQNLTARHWELLNDVLGVDATAGESMTLKQMMEVGGFVASPSPCAARSLRLGSALLCESAGGSSSRCLGSRSPGSATGEHPRLRGEG